MRLKRTVFFLTLALLLLGYGGVSARDVRQGDQCIIGANETIQGNLFALCRTLVINGRVEGNLIGAATSAEINGMVAGDVYLLAGQLDMNGTIGDDLNFGGAVLRILPTATFEDEVADLISVALSTTLADGSAVPGSITNVGYQLVLEGETGGEINFWGSALNLGGRVGGDVDANVGDPQSAGISQLQTLLIPFAWDVTLVNPGLIVSEGSTIAGNLRYTGPVEGVIAGQVEGETFFDQIIYQPDLSQIIAEEESRQRGLNLYVSGAVRDFVTLGVIGLIGLVLLPRPLQLPIRHIQTRPLPSLGLGLLTFILSFPVLLIVLLFGLLLIFILALLGLDTLLLIGAGLVGLVNLGGASVFYFLAIFVSRVIVALWLGRALIRASLGDESSPRTIYFSLVAGVALLALLSPLPVIGWIISGLAVFLGLGSLVISLQSQFRAYRDVGTVVPIRAAMPVVGRRPDQPRRIAPPLIEDNQRPLGMDNLPEGFTWWDD